MKSVWNKSGSRYSVSEISEQIEVLPPGVYQAQEGAFKTIYLLHLEPEFSFPYKIYGKDSGFVKRVKRTYDGTNSNLGILLNGTKGTGKTVTSQLICNALKLPVIIINEDYDNLVNFLNSIQQDVILFMDEYEKTFNPEGHYNSTRFLTIMDGVLKGDYRKVFLMTTNELRVEQNMIQRPSRIRYLKTYNNLDIPTICEILDDKLINKAHKDATLKFIAQLELITIDIVCSIVSEVNIHDEAPDAFADVFNVKKLAEVFDVYQIKQSGDNIVAELYDEKVKLYPPIMNEDSKREFVGFNLQIDNANIGEIVEYIDDNEVRVKEQTNPDEEDEKKAEYIYNVYRIKPAFSMNKIFTGHDFSGVMV